MIRALMLRLGWVPLAEHIAHVEHLTEFRDAALELHAAHIDMMTKLNEFSQSVYGEPLNFQQMRDFADLHHAQGVSEARAERMAQVFNLNDYRKASNDETPGH